MTNKFDREFWIIATSISIWGAISILEIRAGLEPFDIATAAQAFLITRFSMWFSNRYTRRDKARAFAGSDCLLIDDTTAHRPRLGTFQNTCRETEAQTTIEIQL